MSFSSADRVRKRGLLLKKIVFSVKRLYISDKQKGGKMPDEDTNMTPTPPVSDDLEQPVSQPEPPQNTGSMPTETPSPAQPEEVPIDIPATGEMLPPLEPITPPVEPPVDNTPAIDKPLGSEEPPHDPFEAVSPTMTPSNAIPPVEPMAPPVEAPTPPPMTPAEQNLSEPPPVEPSFTPPPMDTPPPPPPIPPIPPTPEQPMAGPVPSVEEKKGGFLGKMFKRDK